MQKTAIVHRAVSLLMVLPLLAGPGTAAAAPAVSEPTYCRRIYLPAVMNGNGNAFAPTGLAASPAAAAPAATCTGFPDFNGDGYADLAIGVPHKEVFDGIVNQVDAGVVQVVYGSPTGLNAVAGQNSLDDQIWHRALGGVAARASDEYGSALAMGDFDRDGFDDLAIGVPGARIDGQNGAGAVQIFFGSPTGLNTAGAQEWSRASAGVDGTAAVDDAFGGALAVGDFDGDGYADLAIGVPRATVGGDAEAGAVHILYGRSSGLGSLGSELLTQDTAGFVASSAEAGDRFGFALAAGDFNGDGVDDLAVSSPEEDNGGAYADAGAVQVFFGGTGHLAGNSGIIRSGAVVNPQHWTADSDYVDGAMEAGDEFGYSLAAGNFNGDAYDDLAVGIPLETHGSGGGALIFGGAINVFHGGAGGLAATQAYPARIWHQDVTDMADEVEASELFGFSLAAADFDNDGYTDLAIGVPGDKTFAVSIGATHLMFGTSIGLTASGDKLIYDPGNPESGDSFGWSVTAGDFNGDGFADLAVGLLGDDPVGVGPNNPGSVFAFYSDATGVPQAQNQNWYPGANGLKGTPATDDYFGSALPGSPEPTE